MSVPWEIPRPRELPAEVEEALITTARTTKRGNISLDEIAKLSLADAYLKAVVEDPHTRACVAWLTAIALVIFGGIKGHFTGISKTKSAGQTLFVGGLAAAAAYALAHAFSA